MCEVHRNRCRLFVTEGIHDSILSPSENYVGSLHFIKHLKVVTSMLSAVFLYNAISYEAISKTYMF